jgi:hypothetical protein
MNNYRLSHHIDSQRNTDNMMTLVGDLGDDHKCKCMQEAMTLGTYWDKNRDDSCMGDWEVEMASATVEEKRSDGRFPVQHQLDGEGGLQQQDVRKRAHAVPPLFDQTCASGDARGYASAGNHRESLHFEARLQIQIRPRHPDLVYLQLQMDCVSYEILVNRPPTEVRRITQDVH